MVRNNQQAYYNRFIEDTVEKTLRECILFQAHISGNKITCSYVPHLPSQQIHCCPSHQKRAAIRTSPSFHLCFYTPTGVCASILGFHSSYYQWFLHSFSQDQPLHLHMRWHSLQIFSLLHHHLLFSCFLFPISIHAHYCFLTFLK